MSELFATGRDIRSSWLAAVSALTWRELARFLRQRTRVVGAVGQPVIFWLLFGAGLRSSFRPPSWAASLPRELSYQEYFLPGIAALIVLFTAIFSTISIIEDRREGFLQGVLVAPVSRLAIVCGKLAGGTILALLQAGLFLAIGPLLSWIGVGPDLSVSWTLLRILLAGGFLMLIAAELTALGFVIAWPINSSQGYHAIMSVFLMPMWLLSGAFFPGGDSGWLHWLIRANPLTYGVAGLRRLLYEMPLPVTAELPSLPACLLVTILTTTTLTIIAAWLVSRPDNRNAV
jgi:ABC-2 type transport system permease protein